LSGSHLATGRQGDATVIFVVSVVHLGEKLASLTLFSLGKPGLDLLLLLIVVSIEVGVLEPIEELDLLLGVRD